MKTCRSSGSSLRMRARLVTALFEAILTMYPGPSGRNRTREGEVKLRASRGSGAKLGSKVNVCESVINLVSTQTCLRC